MAATPDSSSPPQGAHTSDSQHRSTFVCDTEDQVSLLVHFSAQSANAKFERMSSVRTTCGKRKRIELDDCRRLQLQSHLFMDAVIEKYGPLSRDEKRREAMKDFICMLAHELETRHLRGKHPLTIGGCAIYLFLRWYKGSKVF